MHEHISRINKIRIPGGAARLKSDEKHLTGEHKGMK
jgi:hypothetical protein